MIVEGDGREGQPAESVLSLESIAGGMDEGDSIEEGDALEAAEEGDESDATEGEEADNEEAGDDEQDGQEADTFTIKVNGKDVTLTRAEMIEAAQKGTDYSQKTMALSDERKAVEAEKAQVSEARQRYDQALNEQVTRLQALGQFMSAQVGSPPTADMIQTHGIEWYVAQKEAYEARQGELHRVMQALQHAQGEQARQRQAWLAEQGEATEKALRDTLLGWTDTTLNELIAYAGKHGVDQRSADTVLLQKGFWEMAHKAKAYDALQEVKAKQKPVASLPKVAAPKAGNQPSQLAKYQDAVKRYRANPSLNGLAELIG